MAGGPPADGRAGEAGFTLIEMLVALAVFSLAALALLRLESTTLANAATLEARAAGQLVARNVAVETLADPTPPTLGTVSGAEANAGRTWRWTRTVAATGDVSILRVDIAVADERGAPAAALTVVRPAEYPPPRDPEEPDDEGGGPEDPGRGRGPGGPRIPGLGDPAT